MAQGIQLLEQIPWFRFQSSYTGIGFIQVSYIIKKEKKRNSTRIMQQLLYP